MPRTPIDDRSDAAAFPPGAETGGQTLGADFWLFFGGQTISEFGSAFTLFALPLLVFRLTGSPTSLAFATAAGFLPYLMFGLLLGAIVDRLDRKQVMIVCDLGRALVIASVPLLSEFTRLHVWWIYGVAFASTTLAIAFDAGSFAATPSLVREEKLVAANSRLQVGAQAGQVLGPLLAGALVARGLPLATVLYGDAASFLVSTASLALISTSFGGGSTNAASSSIRSDLGDGIRFVLAHPLQRNLVLLLALLNFTIATQWSQLVVFAKDRLHATDSEISILWAAGSVGVIAFAMAADRLRQRLPFNLAVLGAIAIGGGVIVGFAFNTALWLAVLLWALRVGLGAFMGINTYSLRQTITPRHMLSRVGTIGQVTAWAAIPAGALVGGWTISATGDVAAVYAAVGAVTVLLAVAFSWSAIGRYRGDNSRRG